MIIETALVELAKAGGTELFISSSESLLKKVKTAKDIKQLFINTGEFFVDYENDADQLFDDMANVLSKENMTKLANELKDEPGYKLKDRLLNSLMGIMKEYEIPHGMALSYANAILFAIMGQLPVVAPDKYDRAYQAEWKAEQEECFKELAEKFERLRNELQIYQSRQLEILSADAIDLDIRRQTTDPKIGFDFFNVDDDTFKEALESKKNDEVIAIKARCKEEAIYCTINELWMQGENRPIFIVKNEEDWKSLLQIKDAGNIYIPWFYSDQIVTIPNNTNIFVFTERVPSFIKGEITLRPRTYSTISASLQRAGMGINEANKLVSETHGLFIPLKKKLFNGAYLKEPRWINGLQRNIKETALLIGQWTDCDGDKAVIESLSGIKYQDFISEIKEYAKDEDPFIHIVDINSTMVSIIFRHDGDDPEERKTEEFRNYAQVIHRLFDMAKFCPCEENGTVSYDEIKVWVDKLIRILDSNHQKEMFGYVLGRLFAYAPKTADGHYPCEAVCQIIEEYGDESLLSEYRCELFNKREIFSPSAGRAEKDIAEGYKDNAEFLSIKYPKTADVFFKMSQSYVYDSDLERRRAENGYF